MRLHIRFRLCSSTFLFNCPPNAEEIRKHIVQQTAKGKKISLSVVARHVINMTTRKDGNKIHIIKNVK